MFRLEAFISLVIASYIKVVRSLYCLGRADKAPACWMTDNTIQSLTNSAGFLDALINYRREMEADLCHNKEEEEKQTLVSLKAQLGLKSFEQVTLHFIQCV